MERRAYFRADHEPLKVPPHFPPLPLCNKPPHRRRIGRAKTAAVKADRAVRKPKP